MLINELRKLKGKAISGVQKRLIVQSWEVGLLPLSEILVTLRMNRHQFRHMVHWAYRQRVSIFHQTLTQRIMNLPNDIQQLQALVKNLEEQLATERLRNEALNILIDIGKEDYGVDLRKKHGAKQLKK